MQSILIAFDGSRPSTAALEYAFQTFPDANFTVLYTPETDRSESRLSNVKGVLDWLKSSERRAHELRDIVDETSEHYDVSVTSEVVVDRLAKTVIERCETGEVDQVFVGNYSQPGRRSRLFANVTERIVRRVSRPVTAVPSPTNRSFEAPPRTVLVPVDSSKQANRALEYACEMFPNATITGLSVVDPLVAHLDELDITGWETGTLEKWEAEIESHRAELEALERSIRNRSTTTLDRAASRAADHGVELSTISVEGYPAEAILDYIRENPIDHVCMGSHGQSKYERFLLGSTTESVLNDSPVPVTTLRRPPRNERS